MNDRLTFSDYAAIDAVNWSTLREMQRSPLHYLNRLSTPRVDTPAMRFGRAVHTSVLEPDRFPLDWAVYDGRRAGKDWEAFKAAEGVAGRDILNAAEYETCLCVRNAVWGNRDARRRVRGCEYETSATWRDSETGLLCKARLDAVNHRRGRRRIIDLKTTSSIDAREFSRTAYNLGYFEQLAFYRRPVLARARKDDDCPVYIIAVEAAAPHDVGVFRLDEVSLGIADDNVQRLLWRVRECREAGEWPGRYEGEQLLQMPPWALGSDNDMSGLGIAFEVRGESE